MNILVLFKNINFNKSYNNDVLSIFLILMIKQLHFKVDLDRHLILSKI